MNYARTVFAVLFASLALCGCATNGNNKVTLPALPSWRAPANPAPLNAGVLAAGAAQYAPGAQLMLSDSQFVPINAEHARELIAWTRSFLWSINKEGAGFAWTAESLDCDKFAKAFTLAVELSAARAGVKAQPLALRISVNQRAAFGGVPAMPPWADGHALVALVTDAGILIVEPQSGHAAPLADYPNRAHVWRIAIGG